MSGRCKACNTILKLGRGQGNRGSDTDEYCWNCISQSRRQYGIHDISFHHEGVTGIPEDGSTISIEDYIKSGEPEN